mgnify:CR=1 FL=1
MSISGSKLEFFPSSDVSLFLMTPSGCSLRELLKDQVLLCRKKFRSRTCRASSAPWLACRTGSRRRSAPISCTPTAATTASPLIERGAYLARAGNCATCHTTRGGAPYAGGVGIATPFGTVYASNITPDPETGAGRWTDDMLVRAIREGKIKVIVEG